MLQQAEKSNDISSYDKSKFSVLMTLRNKYCSERMILVALDDFIFWISDYRAQIVSFIPDRIKLTTKSIQ